MRRRPVIVHTQIPGYIYYLTRNENRGLSRQQVKDGYTRWKNRNFGDSSTVDSRRTKVCSLVLEHKPNARRMQSLRRRSAARKKSSGRTKAADKLSRIVRKRDMKEAIDKLFFRTRETSTNTRMPDVGGPSTTRLVRTDTETLHTVSNKKASKSVSKLYMDSVKDRHKEMVEKNGSLKKELGMRYKETEKLRKNAHKCPSDRNE